ncbi:MAG TPA: precorrin-6Y C5,15-methyltransferase (decarboxylating) subunit CbiT [Methanobacterium sp.]
MIKDNDFIKDPDIPGPTKEEIRCLVMCKSQVSREDTVVDIGCGTGGLTVEFARRAGKVYAVDKNPQAIKITRLNLEKQGFLDNVELVDAHAPQVLEDLPNFDILMVGGSSGELPAIIKKGYMKLKNNGRIIVTSILLETRVKAVETMKELGLVPEVVDVSISKGRILEGGTLMTAQNPITIISTQKILKQK